MKIITIQICTLLGTDKSSPISNNHRHVANLTYISFNVTLEKDLDKEKIEIPNGFSMWRNVVVAVVVAVVVVVVDANWDVRMLKYLKFLFCRTGLDNSLYFLPSSQIQKSIFISSFSFEDVFFGHGSF